MIQQLVGKEIPLVSKKFENLSLLEGWYCSPQFEFDLSRTKQNVITY